MTLEYLTTDFERAGGLTTILPAVPDDLFFACASFEPRSRYVADCMQDYRVKKSSVYINCEFMKLIETAGNCEHIKNELTNVSDKFSGILVGSWECASEQFKTLRQMIAPDGVNGAYLRITLDITTFNREALLGCLSIIRWAYPNATLRLVYVSPAEYNPSGRAFLQKSAEAAGGIDKISPALIQEHLWLSRGFKKMRNAIGFSGFQKPNLPALLILLPGYEVERPLTLVDNLEPSLVLLGMPTNPTRDGFQERGVKAKEQMVRLFRARQPVEEFEFSCNSVEDAFADLKPIVEKYYDSHNIFLTSLSTKLSLIALFLLAERFEKVQVTSSVPGEYNVQDYSAGTHKIVLFDMPGK